MRATGSGSAAHETGNNQVYHVLCSPTTDVLLDLDLIKSPLDLKTWRTPSSTSKYCVTASREDKDYEEVNAGEEKGRTKMQSHDVLPLFPFMASARASERQLKPSCSEPAPVRLHLHLYLNWHPRFLIPNPITPHKHPSLVPLLSESIAPAFHLLRFGHGMVADRQNG